MKHSNTLAQKKSNLRLKQLKLCALFIGVIAIGSPIVAAQKLPLDVSTNHETLYGQLAWDTNIVATYKQRLPITLRNRKIKHYALTAAVVGGFAGYIWYARQSATQSGVDASSATPTTQADGMPSTPAAGSTKAIVPNTQENFDKLWQKVMGENQNSGYFLYINVGGLKVPYAPTILEPLVQGVKSVTIWSIGTYAFNKATSIFSFREDMTWFYNEEKSIATRGKNLEALALNFDAAVATKQSPALIALKKQALLESAHDYLSCLMSLYVFMEHRSAQVLAKFDPEIRQKLQQKFDLQTTSVMQNGMEFCQKLNDAIAKTAQTPLPATENARTVVMQTHNLVQALVASFVRLEDLYNK